MESDLRRRAREYWAADGIPLLLAAVTYMFIVTVVRFLGFSTISPSDFKGNWFLESFVGPLVAILLATLPLWLIAIAIWVLANWEDVVEWFKIRLTYPRTGYVTPPSYWDGESNSVSIDPNENPRRFLFCRVLDFLGGFWFWAFVQLWKGRPSDVALLTTLLFVRITRYAMYQVPDSNNRDGKLNLRTFLKSVLNSFWFCFWTAGLLSSITSGEGKVTHWAVLAALIFVLVRLLYDVPLIKLLHHLVCGAVCIVLFSRGTTASTTLAWFVPGLYAASVGTFRLVRHLRANPVPQT